MLDLMRKGLYRSQVLTSSSLSGGTPAPRSHKRKGVRRPASTKETERRRAWGAKWGQLIGNLTRIDKEGRN